LLLNTYSNKKKENTKEIIKNLHKIILPLKKYEETKNDIFLRRQVLNQNIYLFKSKLDRHLFSYTKTKK
jgi:hypothetical protein